jgi:hypothetical protein
MIFMKSKISKNYLTPSFLVKPHPNPSPGEEGLIFLLFFAPLLPREKGLGVEVAFLWVRFRERYLNGNKGLENSKIIIILYII